MGGFAEDAYLDWYGLEWNRGNRRLDIRRLRGPGHGRGYASAWGRTRSVTAVALILIARAEGALWGARSG